MVFQSFAERKAQLIESSSSHIKEVAAKIENPVYDVKNTIELGGVTWKILIGRTPGILFIKADFEHDESLVKGYTGKAIVTVGYLNNPAETKPYDILGDTYCEDRIIPIGRMFPSLNPLVRHRGIEQLDLLQINVELKIQTYMTPESIVFDFPIPDFTSESNPHGTVVSVDGVKFYVDSEYMGIWSKKLESALNGSDGEVCLKGVKPEVFEHFLLYTSPARIDIPEELVDDFHFLVQQIGAEEVIDC